MIYDMTWHDIIWFDIRHEKTWHFMIIHVYDMTLYDMIYDITLYDIRHEMTWHFMIYDMTWYMILYDIYDKLYYIRWYNDIIWNLLSAIVFPTSDTGR